MTKQFDVVIVGGAVTGSVLALTLSSFSQHNIRIALIEKSQPSYDQQGGFDARSLALAEGSLQKLAQIIPLAGKDLASMIRQISTPIQHIIVSDQGHFGKTQLHSSELNLTQFGVVVELAKLGENLTACLAQQANITLFCPDTLATIQRSPTVCELTLASGISLTTPLVIAADGIQSQIAQDCKVETLLLRDYQQSAIIANVEISEPHQQQAFERFTAQGLLALLPLSTNRMSLVWCINQPEELIQLSDADFLAKLQYTFGWKLGKFLALSQRYVYPLSSQKAENHIHHRLAIVGNAAQLLHPVAGQGFNLGLRDLFCLASLLAKAFQQSKDLGDYTLLCQYQKQREADQARIMQSTGLLISIFCNERLPYQIIRNLGLIGLSHSKTARQWIADSALGW